MRTSRWDLIFIVLLGGGLVLLNETGHMGLLMKFPFLTVLLPYVIGRYVGDLPRKA